MNVLVIGDEHTYGYGLRSGQLSYINQFIRLMGRLGKGDSISVEAYAHLAMPRLLNALSQLPLGRYDLIILQLDESMRRAVVDEPGEAGPATSCLPTLYPPASRKRSRWKSELRAVGRNLLSDGLNRLRRKPTGLSRLLTLLKPYRHTVVLLTPFPHQQKLVNWGRQRLRHRMVERASRAAFSLFDTSQVLGTGEEYFLTDDPEHLNAVSHELLGQALFDFYQSAPAIVTIQTFRRNKQ